MLKTLLGSVALVGLASFLISPFNFGVVPVTSYGNPQGSPTITTNITPGSGTVASINDGVTADGFKFNSSLDRLKWIMFDFGAGNERCIDAWKIFTDASNTAGAWAWGATNDLTSWAEFLSSFTLGGASSNYTEYTYTNTNGFRYYIMWQKPGSIVSTVPKFSDLKFKIATASAYSVPTNVASYLWKYGFKDRSSFITVTTTSGTGGGTLSNLVDGDAGDNSTDSWWFQGGQTGRSMRFDFGTAVKLTEITFMQDLTTSQGTWQPSFSDDGSTTTNFGSPITWGGAANSVGDLSAWTGTHRYLHLTQVTGTTSSSPFQREILIKGSLT
jgi:hypothetical protein